MCVEGVSRAPPPPAPAPASGPPFSLPPPFPRNPSSSSSARVSTSDPQNIPRRSWKDFEGGSGGVPQGFLGVPHKFLGVPGGSALVPTTSFAPSGADGISPFIKLECCTTLKSKTVLLNSFKHFECLGAFGVASSRRGTDDF